MKGEAGSILPLAIATVAGTLMLGLVFLELGGVQLQTVRNKQVSDNFALAIAGQLQADGIAPVVGLEYSPSLESELHNVVKMLDLKSKYFSVLSHDGKTVEATFCTEWESISGLTFGFMGNVCAKSKARAI